MRKNEPGFANDKYYLNAIGTFFLLFVCSMALLWMMKEYFYFVMNGFVTDYYYFGALDGLQKSLTFAGLGIYPLLAYFLMTYIKTITGFKRTGKRIQASASSMMAKGLK